MSTLHARARADAGAGSRTREGSAWRLYLLIVACVVADVSIVPLLPGLRASQGLSAAQAGVVLSAGPFAMIVAPVPAGRLADHVGAHQLVTAAGALAALACIALAASRQFEVLVVARGLIGLANAVIWTAGLALITDRPAAVANAIGAGGVGLVCGPLLAGALNDTAGTPSAFAVPALLALGATFAFHRGQAAIRAPAAVPGRVRPALRHPRFHIAVLGLLLLGFTRGAADLLVPARLRADGLGAVDIGALTTIAAAVAVASAVLARRLCARHDAITLATIAALALAAAWVLPAISSSTTAVTGFLVATAAARTLLNPASHLLARQGAADAGAGPASALGAANLVLGLAGLAGPLAAALALSRPSLAHASIAVLCLAASATMALLKTRPSKAARAHRL